MGYRDCPRGGGGPAIKPQDSLFHFQLGLLNLHHPEASSQGATSQRPHLRRPRPAWRSIRSARPAGRFGVQALAKLGRHDEARQASSRCWRRFPASASLHAAYGRTCLVSANCKVRRDSFREAVRLEPCSRLSSTQASSTPRFCKAFLTRGTKVAQCPRPGPVPPARRWLDRPYHYARSSSRTGPSASS